MGYHAVRLPDNIEQGSSGGPGWGSRIIELPDSGADEVVQLNSSPRHRYNISYAVAQHSYVAGIRTFYYARGGAANSFPFKDWSDFNSTTAGTYTGTVSHQNQTLGTGDGTTTQFQLIKRYTSGSQTFVRTIRKPVAGTTVVALDTTQQTTGWTVDVDTGIVTFTTAPTLGQLVKAGFEFDVPVRFDGDADGWLETAHDGYDIGSIPPIQLVEVRDPGGDPEDFPYGGSTPALAISANRTIALSDGMVQAFNPSVGSLKVFMPDATELVTGGPRLFLSNGGSFSFDLRTAADAAIATIGVGANVIIALGLDASSNKQWKVFD